ncbi:MAG: polymer-forming cytoskeletal protein [Thermoplasmatota archaeon]
MGFDKKTCIIPPGTRFDGGTIKLEGDAVIGNNCTVDHAITAERCFIGERTTVGSLCATGDVRIDHFSTVNGDVLCGGDAYIGEGCIIDGMLRLRGDLDVGDNVKIRDGFEAQGWIHIRNPLPMVIYVLLYLFELMKRGHSEEVERILKEYEAESAVISIAEQYLFLPHGSTLGDSGSITGGLHVGEDCHIVGNMTAKGDVCIDNGSVVAGSLHTDGVVHIDDDVRVEGSITGRTVHVGTAYIAGGIDAGAAELSPEASIKGKIKAPDGVIFNDGAKQKMDEAVERFEEQVDVVDGVAEML